MQITFEFLTFKFLADFIVTLQPDLETIESIGQIVDLSVYSGIQKTQAADEMFITSIKIMLSVYIVYMSIIPLPKLEVNSHFFKK